MFHGQHRRRKIGLVGGLNFEHRRHRKLLGEVGGMLPRRIWKSRVFEMAFPAFLGKVLQDPNRIKPHTTIFPYECYPAVIWNFQNAIYRRCINIQHIITLVVKAGGLSPPFFPLLQSWRGFTGGGAFPLLQSWRGFTPAPRFCHLWWTINEASLYNFILTGINVNSNQWADRISLWNVVNMIRSIVNILYQTSYMYYKLLTALCTQIDTPSMQSIV